jgi:phytoene dehydrogenase-like protein
MRRTSTSAAAALRERYDAVVVGSGIGGLAAAALLARNLGRRVLVLEKHWTLGGQTHGFSRPGGYHWDVGLHYVGQMGPRSPLRRLMDTITGGEVGWRAMPAGYDRFVYPDLTFVAHADPDRYRAELIEVFRAEEAGIRRYFRDVARAAAWLQERVAASGLLPRLRAWPVRAHLALGQGLALRTTADWLGAHIGDPRLRALLASQWGDYGLPPSYSSFAIHALIVSHYFGGGFYPEGGAQTISSAAERVIESAGGRCLVRAEVTRILVARGRARGVRVRLHGEETEVETPLVISNVGAHLTYRKLLEEPLYPELEAIPKALSVISLYTGLRRSPSVLGIDGANHWIYESYDHDSIMSASIEEPVRHVYLSFPAMKGGFEPATAELLSFVPYDAFARWREGRWKHRGADYEALKDRLSDEMLRVVERRLPGFGALVEYRELSTPVTMEHFTSRAGGLMYGVPATPERFRMRCLSARTPIAGLYLSGSDVMSLGIAGAMVGGVVAAAAASGPLGALRIMKAFRPSDGAAV